jgi:CHAT domain-containing protein
MIRRALLAAAAALALAGPVPAQDPPAPPRPAYANAERFVAAWRAKDEAAMAFVRAAPPSVSADPFAIANELFQRHIEGTLRDPPEPGDFLAAARALAERVRDIPIDARLAALVETWAGMGKDDLRREADLFRLYVAADRAGGAERRAERMSFLEQVEPSDGRGTSVSAACCLFLKAGLLGDLGETEASVRAWRESSSFAATIGWTAFEQASLWQAGYLRYRRGDLPAARTFFEEELPIIDARGNPGQRPDTLRWIGVTRAGLGEFDEGIALVAQGAEEARKGGDMFQAAVNLETLSRLNLHVGRYARALQSLDEAQALYDSERARSRLGLASLRQVKGSILSELGRPGDAVEEMREAVAEFDALGYWHEAARARTELGAVLEALGDRAEALALTEKALAVWESNHDVLGASRTREALGALHFAAGRTAEARGCIEKALAAYESMGNRPGVARMCAALAEVLAAGGDSAGAHEAARRALIEVVTVGDRRVEARAMVVLAALRRAASDPGEAITLASVAVERFSSLGWGLAEEDAPRLRREVRAAADLGILAAADLALADPGMASQAAALAFRLAESSRGILLAEGIVNRQALLAANVPADLRDAESAARGCVTTARAVVTALASRTQADGAALETAKKELLEAYKSLEAAVARVRREAYRVAAVVYPKPVPIEEFRAALGPADAAVLYHFTSSRAFALVVTNGEPRLFDLGETAPIAAAAGEWLDLVSVSGSDDEGLAAALYDALLRPLEGALAGKTRLLVSPDGPLAFLPMEALLRLDVPKRERVVERWEVAYIPSATIFQALAADVGAPGNGILAVGDPIYPGEAGAAAPAGSGDAAVRRGGLLRRLPGTAEEVRAIAGLLPAERRNVLVRGKATGAALREALASSKGRLAALHLACHGRVDPERPRLTGLVLSGGEVLTLDDVYRLRVPADLVVLSACETGRGRLLEGEGAMGLARGFFFAGAPRVVVSDWAVSDEATRSLMEAFYRGLLRDGLPAGRALRKAKIDALRSGGPLAHPAHWAAFVLWGAGRE